MDYLTTQQLSELLQVTNWAVRNWRITGRGPKYYKLAGGVIRYTRTDLDQWLAAQHHSNTIVAD